DATEAVIPNARIVAEHVETGTRLSTQSNRDGFFLFPSTRTGKYRVTAEAAGLEKWQGEFELQIGQEVVLSPVLKIGGTSTQITVAGDVTPLVTSTGPTLATIVERQRIEELPLNGRFFQNLVQQTTPGLEGG